MTEREFIDRIGEQYAKARLLMVEDHGYNIKRGMAHSVSSFVEDIFSVFMAKKIDDASLRFFVDKVISVRLEKGSKAKSFKPDLMILDSNDIMTHYFDLKTNLGWNRYLESYLKTKNDFIKSIRGKKAWIYYHGKDPLKVQIPEDLEYQMVVIYGDNISKSIMDNNYRIAAELECVDVKVLYEKVEGGWKINQEAFDSLYSKELV